MRELRFQCTFTQIDVPATNKWLLACNHQASHSKGNLSAQLTLSLEGNVTATKELLSTAVMSLM